MSKGMQVLPLAVIAAMALEFIAWIASVYGPLKRVSLPTLNPIGAWGEPVVFVAGVKCRQPTEIVVALIS